MSEATPPRINKLPFLFADLAFLAVGAVVVWKSNHPIGGWQVVAIMACVALGAYVGLVPFLKDFDLSSKMAESNNLNETAEKIGELESIANRVQSANAQWHTVQEYLENTMQSADSLATRLGQDARAFSESMQKANDAEKNNLRLEVEKLRRLESDWLKINVGILDHVYALYQAALRSGQQSVINQVGQLQVSVRDLCRRVGISPFEVAPGETFNPQAHQLSDGRKDVSEDARVTQTLATGFTYQGQLIRHALVAVDTTKAPAVEEDAGSATELPGHVEESVTPQDPSPEEPEHAEDPFDVAQEESLEESSEAQETPVEGEDEDQDQGPRRPEQGNLI